MGEKPSQACDERRGLSCFFEPDSVAVIGSFREGFFGGYVIVKSLLKAGFKGKVYPVNPAYERVLGLKVYSSIGDVPSEVDLALIMINARSVMAVAQECAEKRIRALVVISDGFAERDKEGARLQHELVQFARKQSIRIIGPNTAGVVNTANGFNPCPYEAGYYKIKPGPVAICAQTGMVNPQAFSYPTLGTGVSKICDFGNKCDLDECDLLEYLEQDPVTRVISLYLEGIRDGKRFLEIARRVTAWKPVLLLKSGRTEAGAKASASHTGSMAADDRVFEAVCSQTGILRIEKFGELFEMPKLFSSQPLPAGNRLGIMTFTGGVGVLAIDEAAKYGLRLTAMSAGTSRVLDEIFPGLGTMPVDIGPAMAAVREAFGRYPDILGVVMDDVNVDALFNVLWANPSGGIVGKYVEAYEAVRKRLRKPLVTWIYGPKAARVMELREQLEDMGFPVFDKPESAIKALGLAFRYKKFKESAQSARPLKKPPKRYCGSDRPPPSSVGPYGD
jgi:acyl-CoA synthetase (NDP forming)